MRADLVVVGGGLAGLTAATRATELGLRVVLLEAGTGPHYPCNSRFAGGILHAAYQDIRLPPQDLLRRMEKSGFCDPVQARAIAGTAGRAFDWLREHGARIAHFPQLKRGPWVLSPPRPMVTGLGGGEAWLGRGPDLTLRSMRSIAESGGCEILEGTRAEELVMQGGRCRGLVAQTPKGPLRIDARAILLADGGFSGNFDLFRQHIGPAPGKVVQRGAGTGRGDALRMGIAVGAATSALDRFYGHLLSRDALVNDKLWPYPQIDALAAAGVMVDPSGRRLLDEGLGGIHASNFLATLPEPHSTTVIIDSAIWRSLGRIGLVAPDPLLLTHGGTVHRANDVRALARLAGIEEKALAETIDGYNAALCTSTTGTLQPPRSASKAPAMPIVQAPFLAIPVCSGITNTMGGLLVDAQARVLDEQGASIPGLYAAGAATGGLEGGPPVHYVGGLLKALVHGLLAAEDAVQAARVQPTESPKETSAC